MQGLEKEGEIIVCPSISLEELMKAIKHLNWLHPEYRSRAPTTGFRNCINKLQSNLLLSSQKPFGVSCLNCLLSACVYLEV